MLPLQRNKDDRGFILNPFEELRVFSGDIQNFHVCSINKDAVRGNHYHENVEEYILFLGRNFRLVMEDIATGEKSNRLFEESDGSLTKINRKVAHAIKNEGEAPLYLLCFYILENPRPIETVRHQIL
jgi:dTDP-4-dehydrorhamnose 3,5-epimerase-like enzyme